MFEALRSKKKCQIRRIWQTDAHGKIIFLCQRNFTVPLGVPKSFNNKGEITMGVQKRLKPPSRTRRIWSSFWVPCLAPTHTPATNGATPPHHTTTPHAGAAPTHHRHTTPTHYQKKIKASPSNHPAPLASNLYLALLDLYSLLCKSILDLQNTF